MSAPRWYSVSGDGVGYCAQDDKQAIYWAELHNINYPLDPPHRAVQLVELTAEMAAAGEMLKALRKAAVCLAAVCNHAPELGAEDTYSAVDAAIAKAAGQEGGAA